MRHGRLPHNYLPALAALALGAPAASAATAAAAGSNGASGLAHRVAAATDHQLVIAMRQQITLTYAEATYSDSAKRISAEFMGNQLYSGDIKGRWFERTAKGCYSTTKERFVGLSTIGASLLPQSAADVTTITYKQPAPRELRWSIAATGTHGLEKSTVWFNSRHLIVKADDRSYKSGRHGVAQATTVTLTYPQTLPARVPTRTPSPVCKAAGAGAGAAITSAGAHVP
ncbi:MAG: hypothetical protein ACRDLT_13780 [Solirubrobacteraceae bacterium]